MSSFIGDETKSDKQRQIDQRQLKLEIEREVLGCDYGATAYTTRAEAELFGRLLRLQPGMRLLDVGSGCGWPGLYLARTTGCDVTLLDKPLAGLRIADNRAEADELTGRCWLAVGDGTALPFHNGWFDAITHTDVLC